MTKDIRTDEIFRTVGALPPAELTAFLAVSQYGGFRAAARTLDQSASALSHAVASLERRLKVQLFHRSTRNVSLTDAGQRFAQRLTPALVEIGYALEELGTLSGEPASLIRISCDATAAEQVLMPLISEFLISRPNMRFEVVTDTALIDIAKDGFDCGVRLAELVPDEMIAVPIGPEQQHIVVGSPHYLDNAPDISRPADLEHHRCIQLRMPTGAIYRWEFERRGEAFSVATVGHIVVDQSRLLLAAAKAGYGLAYVTRWMAQDALLQGNLRQVLAEWTPPYPGLRLYYPLHRHLSVGMRMFVSFLRKASDSHTSV